MTYIGLMKTLPAIIVASLLSVAPVWGQSSEQDVDEGLSLLEQGAKIIMRSMLDEMEPALKDLQSEFGDALAHMGPLMRDLANQIGDIRNYHPPVKMPNGDIIMRRKTEQEIMEADPDAEIEI